MQEKQKMEASLKSSEERFALAMAGSGAGMWDWDIVANTIYYAPRFRELLGYSPEEFPDSLDSLSNILHPEDHPLVAAAMAAHLSPEHKPFSMEYRLLTRSGEYRWYSARGEALCNDEHKPYRMAGSIIDINDQKVMSQTIIAQRDQIERHNLDMLEEQRAAKRVFDRIAGVGSLNLQNIKSQLSPMSVFNGDIALAGINPSGHLLVLLGDFTGHGLAAAMGALPLSQAFHDMVNQGFNLSSLVRELNRKLHHSLPMGIFCCTIVIEIAVDGRSLRFWNGGLPAGALVHKDNLTISWLQPRHLALGILPPEKFNAEVDFYDVSPGDHLLLWSDGVVEATNTSGQMFGDEHIVDVIKKVTTTDNLFDRVISEFEHFVDQAGAADDITFIDVGIVDNTSLTLDALTASDDSRYASTAWSIQYHLESNALKTNDPLPVLLSALVDLPIFDNYRGVVFTIVSELFSNALEHGVLRLDSKLKDSDNGFLHYYQERERLLDNLDRGFVHFNLSCHGDVNQGKLIIKVSDSGSGFDYNQQTENDSENPKFFGHGIKILRQLCQSVTYMGCGNQVEVEFAWPFERFE